MHNPPKAIIDTSTLIYLSKLGLMRKLILLFHEIRIPRAVEKEFCTKYPDCFVELNELFHDYESIVLRCDDYDSELTDLYCNGMKLHEGESEVMAQHQKLNNEHILIIDERRARNHAHKSNAKVHGVLHILAQFEIKLGVCKYHKSVETLMIECHARFSQSIIDDAYRKVQQE